METALKQSELRMIGRLARRAATARGQLSQSSPCSIGYAGYLADYHHATMVFEWYMSRLEGRMK